MKDATTHHKAATAAMNALHRWEEFTGGPPTDTFVGEGVERTVDWYQQVSMEHSALGQDGITEDDVAYLRARVCHGNAVWARDGFPTFRVTHGLASALLLTECEGTPLTDLQFPLRSFRIDMPGPDYPVAVVTPAGDRIGIDWLHVHVVDGLQEDGAEQRVTREAFDAFDWFKEKDGSMSFNVDVPADVDLTETLRGVPKVGVRELLARFVAGVEERAEGLPRSRTLTVTGGMSDGFHFLERIPLDRLAAATMGSTFDNIIRTRPSMVGPKVTHEAAYQALSLLTLRFLFNFVLYLNDLPAAREGGDFGKRVKAAAVRIPARPVTTFPRVWLVGQDVKLSKEVRDAARAATVYAVSTLAGLPVLDVAREPWALHARHLVRGHWKHQPCGPGRTERRRIWLAPYWRGPDVGIISTRVYEVGEEG